VSSRRYPPESDKQPTSGVSRRGFIRGVGLSGGAAGILQTEAPAEAAQAPKTSGPGPVPITLTINGKAVKLTVEPRVTLLDALRDNLGYTGAKKVCDRGDCGACTVIVGGKAVYACNIFAIDAQGQQIQTVEGLSAAGKLHPVQSAFIENDGLQCGFCTPGFVMAAKAFLDRNPNPTMEQVETGLGGNLCRCGTYVGVRKAVLEASKQMRGGRNA